MRIKKLLKFVLKALKYIWNDILCYNPKTHFGIENESSSKTFLQGEKFHDESYHPDAPIG